MGFGGTRQGGTHALRARVQGGGGPARSAEAPGGPCAQTVDRGELPSQPEPSATPHQPTDHGEGGAGEPGDAFQLGQTVGDRLCVGPPPRAPSKGILGLLLPPCWWDDVGVGGNPRWWAYPTVGSEEDGRGFVASGQRDASCQGDQRSCDVCRLSTCGKGE